MRKLDTGDTDDDYLIQLDRDFDMSWAINEGTSNTNRKHNKKSRMPNVFLASTGQYTWGLTKVEDVEEELSPEETLVEDVTVIEEIRSDEAEVDEEQP